MLLDEISGAGALSTRVESLDLYVNSQYLNCETKSLPGFAKIRQLLADYFARSRDSRRQPARKVHETGRDGKSTVIFGLN